VVGDRFVLQRVFEPPGRFKPEGRRTDKVADALIRWKADPTEMLGAAR
jgi:hypothetical protein